MSSEQHNPNPQPQKMSDYIPPEVLTDILLRLPVKSLLRFRSVSKSWRSLISGPDFISMHTNFASASRSDAAPILLRHYSLPKNKELFSLHRVLDDDMSIKQCQELDCPFISRGVYFRIVGSCNGLLCLSNTSSVILWNPAIRRSVSCSVPEFTVPSEYKSVYGFGFDPVVDDYKVVRVVYGLGVFPQIQVFELGTRVWRGIGAASPPYSVSTHCSQAFVNGAVHWVGYNPDEADYGLRRFVVVSFHMTEETLKEIEFPNGVAIECLQDFTVVVSGEDLTLVQHMRSSQSIAYFDSCCIWVMSEYGDPGSWVRKFNVDLGFWDGIGITLGFCKNNHILLATGGGELILYDLESQSISFVGICGPVCSFFMDTYVESLVLLD